MRKNLKQVAAILFAGILAQSALPLFGQAVPVPVSPVTRSRRIPASQFLCWLPINWTVWYLQLRFIPIP